MTIKKVTVEDLRKIRGGGAGKVRRAERKAIRQLTREYGKDLTKKNRTRKSTDNPKDTTPTEPEKIGTEKP